MTKIFINAGHSKNGNPDPGCCYNGLKEYDLAARIAKSLEEKLIANGFSVENYQQTGSNDANIQLNSVAHLANRSKADIFISIHMNGFNKESAKGTETLYHPGSQKGKKIANCINDELIKPFENYSLTNRGIKEDSRGLAVLKYTNMPAVLTEIGFISNKEEANFISTNINKIAQRLCNGICSYFNVKPKETDKNTPNFPKEITLKHIKDDKYNVFVNSDLLLKENKLSTCIDWLKTFCQTN